MKDTGVMDVVDTVLNGLRVIGLAGLIGAVSKEILDK